MQLCEIVHCILVVSRALTGRLELYLWSGAKSEVERYAS